MQLVLPLSKELKTTREAKHQSQAHFHLYRCTQSQRKVWIKFLILWDQQPCHSENKVWFQSTKTQTIELKSTKILLMKKSILDHNIKTKFSNQVTTCQLDHLKIWLTKNMLTQWVGKPRNKNKKDYKPKKTQSLKKFWKENAKRLLLMTIGRTLFQEEEV